MSNMLILFLVPLAAAVISSGLLKYRKAVWSLFLLVSGFLSYQLFTLYGKWDLSYSLELGFKIFDQNLKLTLGNNPLGWFFAFFAMLTTLMISLFSLGYNDEKHDNKVSPLWLILIFANFGIFFARDWLMFFIMWELMGWASYFVIAHGKKVPQVAARFYISLSLVGASSMLLGIMLLAQHSKTFEIGESIRSLVELFGQNTGAGLLYLFLFALAFLIKSAIFPFYMWPQKAYAEAPDDFTAFFSSVMGKYGIYGIAMFILPILQAVDFPGLNGIGWPSYVLAWLGAISSVLGTLLAMFQTDMKKLFAYSSVANAGYMVMGLSTLSIVGIEGGLFQAISDMIFKTAIFLSLAAVIFRTGEREMHKVGGLVYRMPLTFMTYLLGIIAAAGIPPLNGFPAKWLIIQSLMSKRMIFVVIAMIFASTGAFMYLFRVLASVFLGQLPDRFKNIKEVPLPMAIPMFILMVAMVAIGVVPGLVMKPLGAVLTGMGYEIKQLSWTTLQSSLSKSDVNITHIFYIFLAGFILSVILYLVSGKQTKVAQEDNYTAGEDPKDWGTTAERFNFSYGFYQPFKEMFNPLFERISLDRWLVGFGRNIERASDSVRGLYARGEGAVLMLFIGVLLFIVGGWLI